MVLEENMVLNVRLSRVHLYNSFVGEVNPCTDSYPESLVVYISIIFYYTNLSHPIINTPVKDLSNHLKTDLYCELRLIFCGFEHFTGLLHLVIHAFLTCLKNKYHEIHTWKRPPAILKSNVKL